MRRGVSGTRAFVMGLVIAGCTAGATLAAQQPAAGTSAAKPAEATAAATTTAGELNVTVHYKGKGVVDKAHEITVYVFDTPDIGGDTNPIDQRILEKNGDVATFTGLTVPTAYIAVVYDESGTYEPGSRPPTGTPVAIHGATGPGAPGAGVKTGKGAKVTVTFDDSRRMQ